MGHLRIATALCAATLALPVAAQGGALSPLATGSASVTVSSMSSWRRSVVIAPTGVMWALLRDVDPGVGDGQLYLTASTDGGATWTGRFDLATAGDGAGALCADRSCGTLQIAWNALNGGAFQDVYYQEFDTRAVRFVGSPQQLTTATSSNDQYYAEDVAVTERGAVVLAISTHRSPPVPPWRSGWSSGLLVRPAGAAVFDPVRPVNTDAYGVRIDLQAVGEVVHGAFRTNTGLYGIRYRGFDCATGAFTTTTDVQVDVGTANVSQIAVTRNGDMYVLYVAGGTTAGTGELRVGYSTVANPTQWTVQPLAADTDLLRGNVSYYHYSLATDGLGNVVAFYSRKTGEQHQNLYYRVLIAGQIVTPETLAVPSTDADRFLIVGGIRNPGTVVAPSCIVESRAAVHVGNRVDLLRLGNGALAVEHGVGCAGSLPVAPRFAAVSLPIGGGTLSLQLSDAPASTPGALLFGFSCPPAPIDLTPFGLTGCQLDIAGPDSVGLPSGPAGTARLDLPIASSPAYAGVPLLFQSIVVALGANPANAVTTNALTAVVR
ncbi:MAG: hypothetical protein IPM29_05825 [Planctomycetes bacterium]|nr:hypothetical protein [Planctomycetota bacterium]